MLYLPDTFQLTAHLCELFTKCDVIPVFITPLQPLVAGFTDELNKHQKSTEYADEIEAVMANMIQLALGN